MAVDIQQYDGVNAFLLIMCVILPALSTYLSLSISRKKNPLDRNRVLKLVTVLSLAFFLAFFGREMLIPDNYNIRVDFYLLIFAAFAQALALMVCWLNSRR